MKTIQPPETHSIQYPQGTIQRAERAMRCAPFHLRLFATMRGQSVPIQAIAGKSGREKHYTRSPLTELAAETELIWLIQVGLLRREVDGQGITDSFRLTPLGRQIVEKWENAGGTIPAPTAGDRLYNFLNRRLKLPV